MTSDRIVRADRASVVRAARLIADGGLVAFPTETVYGLGADASNESAVMRIFEAKRRPADHPLIVHVADLASAERWSSAMPAGARALAAAFWPGPLTLIVPRAAHVHDAVTGGQASVGLRVPAHAVAHALLAEFGGGIAAPSANRFGHVSPTTPQHVADDLEAAVDLILDGGACDIGIESTIVAFTGVAPMLLRPGGISADAIAAVLGHQPLAADATAPRASGTLASHYATRTPAQLVATDALRAELAQLADRDERVAVLARTAAAPEEFDGVWRNAPHDADGYARTLYANLRALDNSGVDAILVEQVPDDRAWDAVRDRLARATAGIDDDRN
ncbi:MAG TPA: L-threonylcarbamoyladenylate synthase [Casimicrobiaceae bacterium]|nr:L-threonylcarbamoyladenylate synthase [Casimicrobiaceae bacterium]